MHFLIRIKVLLSAFISFINNLPRKHFFALIILFVCLLIVSFLPSQSAQTKNIKRQLKLPIPATSQEGYSKAEPIKDKLIKVERKKYGDTSFDINGKREIQWTVKEGDSLSNLFQSEGLSAATLHELQEADKSHLRLGNLMPGQQINVLVDAENKVLALKIKIDLANTLSFVLKEGSYISQMKTIEGEWQNSFYQGTVTGSFYVNAKAAGLSAGQIQQISGALQEKFDFNRQFRVGDTFHVLVSKQYINGQYTYDSEVLGILIKTSRQTYTAFLNEDGRYYDADGKGLGKAYRRSPLDGRHRISSSFNPRRLHPITKRISPHNGTDFAVGVGHKVYSIGDGVVQRAGYHPAAGNYIVIKHGRKYTTRYLHLSKIYVHKGERVKMGKLIGKSGNTGRSTGPHLHYEFHINGKPVNAMKVNLPLSQEIPKKGKKAFNERRDSFLKEMNEI
jgi:murein DD-endopeptidase